VLASGFGTDSGPRTPALARLRANGRAFTSAYAPDPDAERTRSAIVGTDPAALPALLRARGVDLLDLAAPASSESQAQLEAWIRERRGKFVVLAAVGDASSARLPPPATFAGAVAPPVPRIATRDLGFSEAALAVVTPPAWSDPARQRA